MSREPPLDPQPVGEPAGPGTPTSVLRLATNTFVQIGGNFGASVIGFLTFVVVTRALGAEDFGTLTTALVYLVLPVLIADVGLATVVLREISADPARTAAAMNASLPLRLVVSVLTVGASLGLAFVLPFSGETRDVIAIGSVGALLTLMSQGLLPVLQAKHEMHWAIAGIVVGRLATLGFTIGVLALGGGIRAVMAATVVGAAVTFLVQLVAVQRIVPLRPALDFRYWRFLLRTSFAVGAALALAQIYFRIDTLLIAALRDPREVGLYGAAYKFIELSDLVGAAIGITVFPLLARFAATDVQRAASVFQRTFDVLLAAAVPLVLLMGLAAVPIVVFTSGEDFRDAGGALQLLAPYVLLSFVGGLAWRTMIAFGEDRVLFVLALGSLILNVAINLVTIPRFGFEGAAVTSVVTEVVAVSASVLVLNRRHHLLPKLRYAPAVATAGAAMAVVYLATPLPVPVRMALAGTAYGVVLLLLPGTVRDAASRTALPAVRALLRS